MMWDMISELAKLIKPSAEHLQRLRFKGKEYVLVGDLEHGGAIATAEQYENGEESYAYLFSDGRIFRHYEQIGSYEDLEVIT